MAAALNAQHDCSCALWKQQQQHELQQQAAQQQSSQK